jgi:hypothetical protein
MMVFNFEVYLNGWLLGGYCGVWAKQFLLFRQILSYWWIQTFSPLKLNSALEWKFPSSLDLIVELMLVTGSDVVEGITTAGCRSLDLIVELMLVTGSDVVEGVTTVGCR